MKLKDLQKVLNSLEELSPNVADFSFGPSYEFAAKQVKKAIKELR